MKLMVAIRPLSEVENGGESGARDVSFTIRNSDDDP
jgi:hypothetical protein